MVDTSGTREGSHERPIGINILARHGKHKFVRHFVYRDLNSKVANWVSSALEERPPDDHTSIAITNYTIAKQLQSIDKLSTD